MASDNRDELLDLSTAAIEGRLDGRSIARLEELLGESDFMCEQWLLLMQFHSDMSSLAAVSKAEKKISASLASQVKPVRPSVSSRSTEVSQEYPRRTNRLLVAAVVSLAACLLVGVAVLSWPGTGQDSIARLNVPPESVLDDNLVRLVRAPRQVATLTIATDSRWGMGEFIPVGQGFSEGESLTLESGTAQISMVSGAEVVLQAPCTILLKNESRIQLEKGIVTVQVAEWAKGFVVDTQGLQVTDLGTRFAVSAESGQSAEVHVLEGSVLVEPNHVRQERDAKLLLVSGEAVRVGKKIAKLDRLVADRKRFVDTREQFRPYRQFELHNSGQGIAIGSDDPHWQITTGDYSSGLWPRQAVVNQPHPRYSDNAPEKSQWISFPGGTTEGVLNYAREDKTFTFETTFDLTGYDPSTVNITAQLLADNGVQEIRLNGSPIDMEPWILDGMYKTFCRFREVEISNGFIDGENRIEIDVINTPIVPRRKTQLNPMALRVEWQAFGRPNTNH